MPSSNVLRVAAGTADAPFSCPWRFWTSGDSAYFALRVAGSIFKASYHPPDDRHPNAVWRHAFTRESGQVFETDRSSHMWVQPPEFAPGWFVGPTISIPKLENRKYDLPPFNEDPDDMRWVPAPNPGNARFLSLRVSDARDDLPPLELPLGAELLGSLPMRNGWHLSVLTDERTLQARDLPPLQQILAETVQATTPPPPGTAHASIVWVTSSPDGPPLFVQIVLDSDSFVVGASAGPTGHGWNRVR